MYIRVSIVAALLLAACGEDGLQDREGRLGIVLPKPDAFPAGKWTGELTSDHSDEKLSLFAGIHKKADAYEVVLEIGSGPAQSFPARQEGANLVVEEASLRDGMGCAWSYLEFERITFRSEGGRLLGGGALAWEEFEDDYFKDVRHGAATFTARPTVGAPTVWNEPAGVFHTPPGKFGTFADEPVLLPDEVTIDLGGDRFSGTVEDAGTWDRNIRVVPSRALPWGSSAEVHVEAVDAAGVARTLSFELPTVAAPTGAPDPLFSTLDGYAAAGIRPLSPSDASVLLDRDAGFAIGFGFGWVLAFEAEVPDNASSRLEIDVVDVTFRNAVGSGHRERLVATIASASSRPVELQPLFVGSHDRVPEELSEFSEIVDVAIHVDLSAFRGERVYISLSGAASPPVCIYWEDVSGLTALKRIEIVP